MSLFRRSTPTPAPAASAPVPTGQGPAISLDKVPASLVNLAKVAAVSLEKKGLTGQRAAVYLVMDHSGSMTPFYADGSMQHLADQGLALSTNLDDDGRVPLIFFGSRVDHDRSVTLDNFQGVIHSTHRSVPWGSTDYAQAIDYVVNLHEGTPIPGLVIFQTDGDPDSERAAEDALRRASKAPLFFAFVGFGRRVNFLKRLDKLRGRAVDNASFFHADDPFMVSDEALYDGLTHEYGSWLTAARAAGIVL
ncbi:VWA domain-containing protein [Streptomyces sp. TRM68367]|uniref:VWA domain-containing protein n=1 Tax=Streptomyces sp. TRM68367 TaxID=2758415 RepID=UPI00165C56E4|nr:VWA domain-containing protein [Streptomyces sp. TRM68367]MBC9729902.1 VWA domain-containing protein [Streptomyces sp. TRM68367]